MKIELPRGVLTKDEQIELGRLLFKAGFEVSLRTGKNKIGKAVVIINYKNQEVEEDVEDLS